MAKKYKEFCLGSFSLRFLVPLSCFFLGCVIGYFNSHCPHSISEVRFFNGPLGNHEVPETVPNTEYFVATETELEDYKDYLVTSDSVTEILSRVAGARKLVYICSFHMSRAVENAELINNWRNMLFNFVTSMRKLGIENYLVFTSDQYVHDELVREGANSFLDTVHESDATNLRKQMFLKHVYAATVVSRGYDVVVADADVVFLKNPTDLFQRKFSFEMMSDAVMEEKWEERDFSTGFFYARSDRDTFKFLIEVIRKKASGTGTDQHEFNQLARKLSPLFYADSTANLNVTINVASVNHFSNGQHYFWSVSGLEKPVAPAVVHASGVRGVAKIVELREHHLWFIDPPGYYTGKRLIMYRPPAHLSWEEELEIFKSALRMSVLTGRALVLPQFSCRHHPAKALYALGEWCSASYFFEVDRIAERFSIRETVFLQRPLTPALIAADNVTVSLNGSRWALHEPTGTELVFERRHVENVTRPMLTEHQLWHPRFKKTWRTWLLMFDPEILLYMRGFADRRENDALFSRVEGAIRCSPEQWVADMRYLKHDWPFTRDCHLKTKVPSDAGH